MTADVDRLAMIRLFEEIRAAFPQLSMRLNEQHEHVELYMEIPQQPGLAFAINLNLQADELHLSAGAIGSDGFRARGQKSSRGIETSCTA